MVALPFFLHQDKSSRDFCGLSDHLRCVLLLDGTCFAEQTIQTGRFGSYEKDVNIDVNGL